MIMDDFNGSLGFKNRVSCFDQKDLRIFIRELLNAIRFLNEQGHICLIHKFSFLDRNILSFKNLLR